jgi:trehalose 6-phosphate synthase
VLDPSRQDVTVYADYLAAIERATRTVNKRFERPGWTPVDLQVQDDFHQAVAAYKQYDVLLVNAIFDGLNLVAKEAPLLNERDGVLVLSENAGAFEQLSPYSVAINPFDIRAQADAIYEALTMERGERRRRLEGIRALVCEHDLDWWINAQLAELEDWMSGSGRATRAFKSSARRKQA